MRVERDEKIKKLKINIDESIMNHNKKVKSKLYCKSLATALYDPENLFSIAFKETNNFANENHHAISILDQITLEDYTIIIFDRKYYSVKFLQYLHNKKIIPIFRLDKDNKFSKKLIEEDKDSIISSVGGIPLKIIKYQPKCAIEDFFVATTKINYTNKEIEALYWKRWSIEESYKVLKHKMKGWFYNKNTKNNYISSIKSQHLGCLFSRIMCIIAENFNINNKDKRKCTVKETKNKRKINFKECMNISIEHILYDMLIEENNDNTNINIIFELSRINNSKYTDVPDRKNKRIAILNKGRWNFNDRN